MNPRDTCRHCHQPIEFKHIGIPNHPRQTDDWDWCTPGTNNTICTFTISRRHYPVNPVAGIDY